MDHARIEKCVAYRTRIRLSQVLRYSDGSADNPELEMILVEVGSGGFSGFGEFYPTSINNAPGSPGTSSLSEWDEINAACSHLPGQDAVHLRRLIPEKYLGVEDASGIVDCVDFALHDLVGKVKGIPAWTLLGGRRRSTVPAMPVIHTDDIPAMARKARGWQEKWGIRLFKLKPHADHDRDVEMMMAFAEVMRPGTKFLFDAGFAYKSMDEVIRTHMDVAELGVFITEDPIKADYAAYREKLRPALNQVGIELMLDEQARDLQDFVNIVTEQAADIVNFHANWHSGFAGALDRAAVCKAGGIKTFMGSSVYTGIADAANIMLASVFPNLVACEQVRGADFYLAAGSIVDEFYPLINGEYHIPDRPGLGVDVNRKQLERLRVVRREYS